MDYFPFNIEYNLIYMLPGVYQPLRSWTTCCLIITARFWGTVLTDLSTCTLHSKITGKWGASASETSKMPDVKVSQQEPKMPMREPTGASSSPLPLSGRTSSNIPIKAALHVIKVRYINFTNLNCCLMFLGKSHVFLCAKMWFQLRTLPQPRWVLPARQDHFLHLG